IPACRLVLFLACLFFFCGYVCTSCPQIRGNLNRREIEQLAAADLAAKDNYIANQRVATFMRSLNPRKNVR
ncbi:hypothetical protein, partial [Ereboglobus sp. PH5-10]|uniref:hypothetical protein n=1 Tax=Ereboglobus sp. PH5-10 TaxID=2940629 RepID=UPI00240721B6